MKTNLLLVLVDVPTIKLAMICDFEVSDFAQSITPAI
jgi:hypothetical protein